MTDQGILAKPKQVVTATVSVWENRFRGWRISNRAVPLDIPSDCKIQQVLIDHEDWDIHVRYLDQNQCMQYRYASLPAIQWYEKVRAVTIEVTHVPDLEHS